MNWDYHLQRRHFQDTKWRIQSIDEIWIVRVFIKPGTHSTALSQYPSIPAKLLFLSGILTSPYGYGMDSESQMDLLDVPISMYDVVPNCWGVGPKPGKGRSVTVPVLPSNKQYTSLAASIMDCTRASWYVDAFVQRKHVCHARYATETIAVRTVLLHKHQWSFWTIIGHTSPGDTNSGTAWWLLARSQLPWHSPNGLGFAPVCWELRYRDLWMRHREPAEVVTLAGWMSEQGAAAVVAAVGCPHGNPEWLLPARRDTKGVTGRRGLAPCGRTVNDKASWIYLPPLPSFLWFLWLTSMKQFVRIHASLQCGHNVDRRMTIESALTNAEDLRGSPGMSPAYRPSDDELREWMFQLLERTRNGITPDRYERMTLESYLLRKELSLKLWELDLRAPICPFRRCTEMDDNQSFDYGDIQEVMWKSTRSNILTFDDNDNLRD